MSPPSDKGTLEQILREWAAALKKVDPEKVSETIRTALPKDFDPENAAKAIEAIHTARPLGVDQAERDLLQTRRIAAAVAAAQQKRSKPPGSGQAEAAAWLLARATKENRKLKQSDYRKECMAETGATWDEYLAAMRDLPERYRYKRGNPGKS
jgi:hypothetical protein